MLPVTPRNALLFAGGCLLLTAVLVGSEGDAGLAAGAGQLVERRADLAESPIAGDEAPPPSSSIGTWASEDTAPIENRVGATTTVLREQAAERRRPEPSPPPGTRTSAPGEGPRMASAVLGRDHGDSGAAELAKDLRQRLPR